MKTDTETPENALYTTEKRRYIFTRMVPTAVIVFFILFTFYPRFGNPISNLRGLGGNYQLTAQQKLQQTEVLKLGLEQLQANGELGSYLQASGGGTNNQTLSWDSQNRLLSISNGNSVDLGSLVAAPVSNAQNLTKTGNTLGLSGSVDTVDLGSYLDNTDAQTVGLAGTTLTISGGNSINLAPINTDSQTLSLAGADLSVSGGNTVNLASINTDVLAGLSCTVGQVAQWDGSAWVCASPAAVSDAQTLSLASNNLSILNGNSVSLAGYLDNTDSQTLSYNTGTHIISISGGNTQDLSNLLDNTDSQAISKAGDTLSISGNASTVDLSGYLDNTDSQAISKAGNTLSISGNASTVDLSAYLDNTDLLASMSCSNGQMVQWNGSAWVCTTPSVGTDSQNLSLVTNTLSISGGNSVSLAGYLDNTDAQAISLASNVLSISGNASTVNLAPYLDNTDAQTLSLGGNTLSLVNGGSVNLAPYLDNTDVLASLACGAGQIAKWNGIAWACAADNDTVANEAQVDAWVANNGYLTSEVDGSTSNELQTLTWNGGTHILTISSGNTADLGSLLDNTDAQAISRTGNTISITGNASTVDLAPYLDNTDAQAISRAGNTLSISGNASTVDLSSYLDNTDSQTVGLAGTTLTISGGNSIDLAPINTDSQTLGLAGTNLSITGGNTIDLASINTDVLAGLSCGTNQIAKWNGSAWACAADVDTDTDTDAQTLLLAGNNLSILNGNSVSLAGYLDNTDSQTLSYNTGTHIISISGGNTQDLSNLLDNTDSQAISKAGNTLSITGNASTVDLSGYLDNTDSQSISKTGNTLNISGNASTVDLSAYLDNTDLLASLSCGTNQIAKWNGSAWACAADVDTDTDAQTLNLASNNLSISSGNSVSLAGYLDNTDAQAISLASNILSISGNAGTVDLAPYLDNTDSQSLSLGGNTLSLVNGGSVNLAPYLDNTDVLASLSCSSNEIPKWNGSAWACAADVDTVLNEAQVDAYANNNGYLTSEVDGSTSNELQTLSWNSGTHILTISSGNTADLGSLLDNTDAQAISKAGNTLSISGNASTVDLSSYLDNTDSQTVSLGGTTLTISGGNSIDLAPINTDSQNLSLAGTTLNISGGTGVDIASINTDVLAGLSCGTNQIAKWNGSAWACAADVDTVLNEGQVDTYVANNGYLTSEVDGSVSNEIQSLSLVADVLSISGDPGTIDLSGYLDNTDSQTLSYNTGTHIISISGGNTQDLSNLLDNTDSQAISKAGDTLSISGNASTVNLSGYLDNTDSQAISKAGNTLSISGNASTVDLSAYLDNTDVLASLSCGTNQIAKWNGSLWACAADVDTVLNEGQVDTYVANNGYLTSEGDGVVGNEVTDATVSGGLTRSGSGTGGSPYTLGISAGGVTNAMLVNSGLTVSAGNGLANGGSVSLGGTTTLNIGAGNGITVNADDITVKTLTAADALSSTTSSGSGIEVLASGIGLLQGCSDTQILKWNETTDVWACAADAGLTAEVDGVIGNEVTDATASGGLTRSGSGTAGSPYTLGIGTGTVTNAMLASSALTISAGNGLTNGGAVSLGGTTTLNIGAGTGITVNADDIAITADGLNFTELSDTLTLDAATTITLGANNFTTNVNSTGTYALQANGNTVLQVLNSGAVTIGNILSDQAIGIDNGTGAINIATDSDANTTNIGTGTGADTVTIGDSNANVSLTDAQWSITGAGVANFASTTGSGLTDCKQQNSKLLWDSSTGQFSCGTDRASVSIRKSANETVTSSTALQDDDELLFAVGANETWVYDISYIYTTGASATPDIRVGVNGPTGATCAYQVNDIAHAGNASSGATACNASLSVTTTATGTKGGVVTGSVTTSATAGNVAFRWAQNTSSTTSTVVVAGSSLVAFKLTGADYAETYYSTDSGIQKGQLVELEGNGRSQVKKARQPYSDRVLGIVSTQPGQVVGAADGYGKPVQVALAGRVPIKLSTENGLPKAGDMITSSASMPGYGMKAIKSGNVFGQLMLDATDNGDGTADGFVFVRNGYWQAPVTIDLSTVFGSGTATNIGAQNTSEVAVLGLSKDMAATYSGFDQSVVDTIMQGFSLQQDQIISLDKRLKAIEDSNLGVLSADSLARLDDGTLRFMNDVHFAGTTSFDNPVLASADSAGVITIPAGADQGVITFKRAYAGVPKVVVSPNSFVDSKWRIKDVTKDSFTIQLSDKLTEEVEFTWQAVLTQ